MKTIANLILLLLGLCAMPVGAQTQFILTTNNGAIDIVGYTGSDEALVIPDTINGWPVVSLAPYACSYKSITNVTIGNNVTNIGPYAFWSCLYLHNVTIPKNVINIAGSAFCADGGGDLSIFFQGDPPTDIYGNGNGICGTLYYLPGTEGWDQFLQTNGYSGKLWNPQVQTSDGSFGVISNQFGFNITGTPDIPVRVETCTNLGGVWIPLQSVSLTNGSFYFSDPKWKDDPCRFYRIHSP